MARGRARDAAIAFEGQNSLDLCDVAKATNKPHNGAV